jgi:hypothetical protein
VAPGVRWLRMALPFALDHINLWLLRDRIDGRDGWTVVDCGIDNADTRARWEQVFDSQLDGLPGAARDRHAHAPGPHRPGALADRALGTPGHECRCGSAPPTTTTARLATQEHQRLGRRRGGRLLCAATA